ncbi:ubiquinone biosynthesis accessory factor UbiJ [Burkholderia gladioli]|uniref:ubiquinone biosynthesis accessory factor UbiJ n=1 Tax=Burkholderia gladioli TaxID=28095 RepID=UPI0016409008|nr:SCP2 sterol-binding domain-containing protein [Burkholderia gladioli]
MTFAAKSVAAAVNHLLARESWARERLIPYAGKTARLEFSPLTLLLLVQPDGYFAAVEAHEAPQPDVSIALGGARQSPFDAVTAFVQGGQAAVMKHVKLEGDAEFATQLAKLAEHLRWEPEEDLARVLGDAPAHRIATLVRSAGDQARRTSRNLLDSLSEYFLDENPQVVRRAALGEFDAELARARDALARVEKRIERLEQRSGTPAGDSSRGGH